MSKAREVDDKYEWAIGHDEDLKEICLILKSDEAIRPEEFVELLKQFTLYAEMNTHDLFAGRLSLENDNKLH